MVSEPVRISRLMVLFVVCVPSAALAADWPNWRGPNHDGICSETGLRTQWDRPLPMVWEREIGASFSSFSCVDDRLYTCGTIDDQQTLFCLNAATGKVVWRLPFEKQFRDSSGGNGTRATPTVSDGRVYVLGGHGTLFCADATAGSELWRKEFHHPPRWGYSGSVLIEDETVIVSAGGEDGALVALDAATGKTKWNCGDDAAGYATPYPFTFEGRRYIAGFMADSAILADAATGKLAWRMEWETDWGVNAATPIFHQGHLFLSSGYRHGCILLKLRSENGGPATDTIWQSRVLRNKFQSPVLWEGHLYSCDEKGLKCVEFRTGEEKWSRPRTKHGTVLIADGHLYVLTQDGTLFIAPATAAGFEPVTEAKILSGRCWTVPVIYGGRLYARNLERVVCFDLRAVN